VLTTMFLLNAGKFSPAFFLYHCKIIPRNPFHIMKPAIRKGVGRICP